MSAECMNKTVVEVNRMAALDGEPVKGASNIEKGDEMVSGGYTWF